MNDLANLPLWEIRALTPDASLTAVSRCKEQDKTLQVRFAFQVSHIRRASENSMSSTERRVVYTNIIGFESAFLVCQMAPPSQTPAAIVCSKVRRQGVGIEINDCRCYDRYGIRRLAHMSSHRKGASAWALDRYIKQ